MNHDEFERLSEATFEDRAPEGDRARLEALAAGDPELRGRWDDLLAARSALGGTALEALPAGMHEALLGAARSAAAPAERFGWRAFITAAIQARPVFALGGAVAAGLAIGVIGIGLLMAGLGAGRDLAPGTTASLPPVLEAVSTASLEAGSAQVSLTSRRSGSGLIVRIMARDATPATVALTWDPTALRLTGVRWESPEVPAFEPGPGRVSVRVPTASGSEFSFDERVEGAGDLRVRLSTESGGSEAILPPPR